VVDFFHCPKKSTPKYSLFKMFWKKPSIKQLLPPPVKAAHAEYSMIASTHDDPSKPTSTLLDLSLEAITAARSANLSFVCEGRKVPSYTTLWPGEHYKLLSGLVSVLKPKLIVEIGTATGLSALCMRSSLPPGGQIMTFDIVPWQSYKNTVLKETDFSTGSLTQSVENLAEEKALQKHAAMLKQATFIFIDATHDGTLEAKLLESLHRVGFKGYILLDDIRVWTMLKMWRDIQWPKIDLTSMGHWSGTGLVEMR
jgi:predicted O-methyltransferase YrrM